MREGGEVVLKPGREGPVVGGHPWIYSGAVAAVEGAPGAGEIVRVRGADGRLLGRGSFSPRGAIAVRLFLRGEGAVDADLVRRRVEDALLLRRTLLPGDTTAYRVINGEGDALPGVVVDWYDGFAVVQLQTAGAEAIGALLDQALGDVLAPRGVFERSEGTVRREDGLRDRTGLRSGEEPPEVIPVREGEARFLVDVRAGQKTGFFLDQRDNRALVRTLAAGKRVVNAFAYTGAFGVLAGLGGAAHVTSIESSPPALALAERHWRENDLPSERAAFVRGDAFQYFREDHEPADLVILDPPAFAKRRRDTEGAIRGYREINRQAFLRLRPGGWLLTCSCSHHVSRETFRVAVMAGAAEAKRAAQIVRQLGPGADHPVALAHPEGDYLKGLLVRALR
jgi:23S rRNA (cytosine1962-C5)-methyltransferase